MTLRRLAKKPEKQFQIRASASMNDSSQFLISLSTTGVLPMLGSKNQFSVLDDQFQKRQIWWNEST